MKWSFKYSKVYYKIGCMCGWAHGSEKSPTAESKNMNMSANVSCLIIICLACWNMGQYGWWLILWTPTHPHTHHSEVQPFTEYKGFDVPAFRGQLYSLPSIPPSEERRKQRWRVLTASANWTVRSVIIRKKVWTCKLCVCVCVGERETHCKIKGDTQGYK